MPVKTWRGHPLKTAVVETLQKKGAISDEDLLSFLKDYGFGHIGFADLNRILLRLEIEGVVHVSSLSRGKRRVELRKKKE